MNISGIILAGGKSSRMGKDKGLLYLRDKRLIEYQIDFLQSFCNQILISSNSEEYENLGFPVVKDNYTNCGPIGGLEATLKLADNDWCFVVSCDTPFLQLELINEMLPQLNGYEALLPHHENGMEPLAAFYQKGLASFFESRINQKEYKLQRVLKERNISFFQADTLIGKYPKLFYNINFPSDLEAL